LLDDLLNTPTIALNLAGVRCDFRYSLLAKRGEVKDSEQAAVLSTSPRRVQTRIKHARCSEKLLAEQLQLLAILESNPVVGKTAASNS